MYVVHTSCPELDIEEVFWIGVRPTFTIMAADKAIELGLCPSLNDKIHTCMINNK